MYFILSGSIICGLLRTENEVFAFEVFMFPWQKSFLYAVEFQEVFRIFFQMLPTKFYFLTFLLILFLIARE